jgi:hypothetical protein
VNQDNPKVAFRNLIKTALSDPNSTAIRQAINATDPTSYPLSSPIEDKMKVAFDASKLVYPFIEYISKKF